MKLKGAQSEIEGYLDRIAELERVVTVAWLVVDGDEDIAALREALEKGSE
jgi:hypothetical protein